jgi:3-oxoacyl-[acyl-carrier-protein] synthase II
LANRVVISGIGVLSPIGIGREDYFSALCSGRSGVSNVDLIDCSPLRCRMGAQVAPFDAAALIGKKALRYVDRLSQFAIASTKLAIEDAGLSLDGPDSYKRGVVVGTAFGGLTSQKDFNRERVLEGPKWVSPMKFPNTPINALTYQIPIRHQMRLVNVTISAGMTSSLEAMRYALTTFRRIPDAILVCGGVEELSYHAYYSSYFLNELAGLSGEEISCPFDERHNGYILGEGGVLLVLESLEGLAQRGGRALAEILGYGSCFSARSGQAAAGTRAITTAIRMAIRDAGIKPEQIDFIAASANSSPQTDAAEVHAIKEVFGPNASSIPVSAIKSMVGEAFGASGALQIAAAILTLERGVLPPTINLKQPSSECTSLNFVTDVGCTREVRHALVNSIDRYGAASSVVLGQVE